MTDWQYFCVTDGPWTADSPPTGLGRSDKNGPRHNAEMLTRDAVWKPSEYLMRYHVLGTNEDDCVLISEDRANEIVGAWVSSGRLPHAPDEP